jgi:hypothetical protein
MMFQLQLKPHRSCPSHILKPLSACIREIRGCLYRREWRGCTRISQESLRRRHGKEA